MVICGQEFEFSILNANDMDRFEDANEQMQQAGRAETERFNHGGVRLGDYMRAQARIVIPLSPTAEGVSQKRFKALSAGQLKVHGSQTRSMCSSWQAIR